MDRIGHRRLQLIGFSALVALFAVLPPSGELTSIVGLFVAFFGVSYFFVQFGPNTTTFVLPSEVFPLDARTTGHGASAGIGKLGAFAGVFLVPQLQNASGSEGCSRWRPAQRQSGSARPGCFPSRRAAAWRSSLPPSRPPRSRATPLRRTHR